VIASDANNYNSKQHNVILEDRKKLVLSGVEEVESFEEDAVELKTTKGKLSIRGEGLKMESYLSEVGDLIVKGNVYALVYLNDTSKKQGFISRLFK